MRKIRKISIFESLFVMDEHEEYDLEPYVLCSESSLPRVLVDNDDLKYIIKHFDELCKYDHDQLSIILNYLKMNTYRIRDKNFLEKLKNSLIYNHIIYEYERLNVTDDDVDRVRFLLNKLAEDEGVDFFDLREISRGSYSTAYRLGNKVVKVGRSRATKIIDNSRILIPDQMLRIGGNIIEINDYVKDVRSASNEKVYEVYKELREQGIIWMDPWFLNLGKLDRATLESQREKEKHKSKMPFLVENRKIKQRELKTGDYVIIDLDHLVDETNKEEIKRVSKNLDEMRIEVRKEYEKRYILEKKKDIK